MNDNLSEGASLSSFYSVFPWPDTLKNVQGKQYFENTLEFMEKLIQHPWIKKLYNKKKIKILELCGGVGFGGIALFKAFVKQNVEVELVVTDLRDDALQKAEKFSIEVLQRKIKTLVVNAQEIHKINEKFDLILMYGYSTPHFNPWELVKVFSSVGEILQKDGIFVLDEVDRRYKVFLNTGYKWVLAEGDTKNHTVFSVHTGYDLLKGTVKRSYIDFNHLSKPVIRESFLWSLAEVSTLIWLFFKDVDLVKLIETHHFILGHNPRRAITPDTLSDTPTLFNKRK